jgi:RNA polymerase sigma-70 factor (ECF subfamily)
MDKPALTTQGALVASGGSPAAVGASVAGAVNFETMFHRYGVELHRYALQLTRNGADADDLYQETFLKAFRAFSRLDGNANHRAWLYRIATNTFLSHRRKFGRVDALEDDAPIAAPSHDQAAQLDARGLLAEVELFIEKLPSKQRVALILRKYHEMDYADIAANLRCSEPAARANVHEALRKLRNCFGDRL